MSLDISYMLHTFNDFFLSINIEIYWCKKITCSFMWFLKITLYTDRWFAEPGGAQPFCRV
ncbi:hypothetical protein KSZ_67950 [Dictyobacter formicarum]|uniref:Uncharacterized protein n=1 Tax=Dictyobacter formicarum TaxID=2778368 RepID=A0ABQ3VSV6_9CHLR|nr:hypothetical protein KSZ_67950 [Dictyobacter formicarum]